MKKTYQEWREREKFYRTKEKGNMTHRRNNGNRVGKRRKATVMQGGNAVEINAMPLTSQKEGNECLRIEVFVLGQR